jgi:hypothetical protein
VTDGMFAGEGSFLELAILVLALPPIWLDIGTECWRPMAGEEDLDRLGLACEKSASLGAVLQLLLRVPGPDVWIGLLCQLVLSQQRAGMSRRSGVPLTRALADDRPQLHEVLSSAD